VAWLCRTKRYSHILVGVKGDVFNLVQHLDPFSNRARCRQALRGFVGAVPTYPVALHERKPVKLGRTPAEQWARRPRLWRGDCAWMQSRGSAILEARIDALNLATLDQVWTDTLYEATGGG
jgi:hypothetical protein